MVPIVIGTTALKDLLGEHRSYTNDNTWSMSISFRQRQKTNKYVKTSNLKYKSVYDIFSQASQSIYRSIHLSIDPKINSFLIHLVGGRKAFARITLQSSSQQQTILEVFSTLRFKRVHAIKLEHTTSSGLEDEEFTHPRSTLPRDLQKHLLAL